MIGTCLSEQLQALQVFLAATSGYVVHYNFTTSKFSVTVPANVSVLLILGPKCTLAASRAAPWRVTLSVRRAPY